MKLISGVAAIAAGFAIAVSASAQDLPWQDLNDDSPRSDFFYLLVQEKNREEKLPVPSEASAVSFALAKEFKFPRHTTYDDELKIDRSNAIFGIDISHHNGPAIDFTQLRVQNVRFVYAKATQGVGYRDPRFSAYWKSLGDLSPQLDVHRGAYHFLSHSGDGAAQARSFLKQLRESGGLQADDLPPVLDLEWDVQRGTRKDRWSDRDPDEIIQNALAWLQTVEAATGKVPILYTARAWWRERIGSDDALLQFSRYGIWIADYSRSARGVETPSVPGNHPWLLWQFTENGGVQQGYKGHIDVNIFRGSEDEFLTTFQLKP
jgi:lysozyme